MKLILLYGVLVILSLIWCESFSKSVLTTRKTHGNIVPSIKKTFVTFTPEEATAVDKKEKDLAKAALKYYSKHVNVSANSIKVSSCYSTSHNGLTHAYFQQVLNGLEVVNGVGNINIDKNRKTISLGNSFYTGKVPAVKTLAHKPSHTAKEAWSALTKLLNVKIEQVKDSPSVLKYLQNSSGHLRLVWQIRADTDDNMYNACVDAETLEVLQLVDWVAHASLATYNVFRLGVNDPSDGSRSVLVNPANKVASPLKWHSQGFNRSSTKTIGNNVIAQENFDGGWDFINNIRPDGTSTLKFDFPLNLNKSPPSYLFAAVTNLFYMVNAIHDLFYVFGFNEVAGNFQENNVGRGGKSMDALIANAQDGGGINSADFATPPDGLKPRMRMFLFRDTSPRRDADLDNGIIIHEYSHGLSNRLTGGPNNVGCLSTLEASGMGEGWGDFIETILRVTPSMTRAQDFKIGEYLTPGGLRKSPYSTNMQTNPSTYSFLKREDYQEPHAVGEVWAVMLYECFWNFVNRKKFEQDWYNVTSTAGNIVFLQAIIDGMKTQPCNPSFVDARDAIIRTYIETSNGDLDGVCDFWVGFAKRGLGLQAQPGGVEDFSKPPCDAIA